MTARRQWTAAEDDALVAGYRHGDSAAAIARRIGVDVTDVHNRARKLGLRHRSVARGLAERFFDRVSPEPNSGCWLWTGATDWNGYGRLYVPRHGVMQVSHVALALAGRTPPAGANVHRSCGLPACTNPDHLFLSRRP